MQPQTTNHKALNKKIWITIVVIIVLALIAYLVMMKPTAENNNPEAASISMMNALDNASAPITLTEQQRLDGLNNLDKTSTKVTTSKADLLKELDALKK